MLGASLVRPRAVTVCGLLSALALAGCATQTNSAVTVSGKTLTVYPSQPPGAARRPDRGGRARRRAAGAPAGRHQGRQVHAQLVRTLHGAEISDNARTAVQDSRRSPTRRDGPGDLPGLGADHQRARPAPGQPHRHRGLPDPGDPGGQRLAGRRSIPRSSTYHETFARVVPTSAQEAKAIAAEMHSLGLSKLYVSDDGGALRRLDRRRGAHRRRQAGARDRLQCRSAADAVFYGGNTPAVAATGAGPGGGAAGSAKLFVPSALYDDAFVAALSAAAQRNLYVSSPGFAPADLTPAGRQFVTAFRDRLRPRAGARGHLRLRGGVRADGGPQGGRERGRQPRDRGQRLPDTAQPTVRARDLLDLLRGHEHRIHSSSAASAVEGWSRPRRVD